MRVFNDIGKKVAQTGQQTVKKAKSMTEIVRINTQITEEQRALKAFYTQMGEKYYTLHKDDPGEEFTTLCDRITASLMRVAELQDEVRRHRNTKLCPKCGAACPANVQFCSTCGTQLPQPDPEPEAEPEQAQSEEGEASESGDDGTSGDSEVSVDSGDSEDSDNAENSGDS
ncbi:MAG: zinc ribbon domain-containing protein [Oscillospiraceae bacterium]|nr:zinc ribbon domain-containing protein [Oscillospiraceae bacterium]